MFQTPLHSVRTIIIENQSTFVSQKFDIPVHPMLKQVKIYDFIISFMQKNQIVLNIEWKVYDPKLLDYRLFSIQQPLSEIYFLSPVIMLKYREFAKLKLDEHDQSHLKIQEDDKKGRKRERTIKQVIQYVKQWRQLHNSVDKHNNKISLIDAARIVGIAKKSLDDYFCQLRLAQNYGFNFELNINEKIGAIRSFVRKCRSKGSDNKRSKKHPKKLKIIEGNQHLNLNIIFQKLFRSQRLKKQNKNNNYSKL